MRAAALSAPVEAGEEDAQDDDGEEEREVSFHVLQREVPIVHKHIQSDLSTSEVSLVI